MESKYLCVLGALITVCYVAYVVVIHGDGVVFGSVIGALAGLGGYGVAKYLSPRV